MSAKLEEQSNDVQSLLIDWLDRVSVGRYAQCHSRIFNASRPALNAHARKYLTDNRIIDPEFINRQIPAGVQYSQLPYLFRIGQWVLKKKFTAVSQNAWLIFAMTGDTVQLSQRLGSAIGTQVDDCTSLKVAHLLIFGRQWEVLYNYIRTNIINISDITEEKNMEAVMLVAGSSGQTDIVKKLAVVADIELTEENKMTLAVGLAIGGHFKEFIEFTKEMNMKKLCEREPRLHIECAEYGFWDLSDHLVNQGFDPLLQEELKPSLLHAAAYHGETKRFEDLISLGLNKNHPDMFFKSPMHWAADNGQSDVLALYSVELYSMRTSERCDVVHSLVAGHHTTLAFSIEETLERDTTTIVDLEGNNFLLYCAKHGNSDAFIQFLPKFGQHILTYVNTENENVFDVARKYGQISFIEKAAEFFCEDQEVCKILGFDSALKMESSLE